jgi:hypothetical protein
VAWSTSSPTELPHQINNTVWFKVLAGVMMNINVFGVLYRVDWLIIIAFPEELINFLSRIKQSDK